MPTASTSHEHTTSLARFYRSIVHPIVRLTKLANVYIVHCCLPFLYSTRVSQALNIANDGLSADSYDICPKNWETIMGGVVGFCRAAMGAGFSCIW